MGKDGGRGQITRLQPFGSRHRAPFLPFPSSCTLTGCSAEQEAAALTAPSAAEQTISSGCQKSAVRLLTLSRFFQRSDIHKIQ